jgi:hypothetical protein
VSAQGEAFFPTERELNGHDRKLGHIEEARALIADWLKKGAFSIAMESCFAITEPMKSAFLDDLREAGLPEK